MALFPPSSRTPINKTDAWAVDQIQTAQREAAITKTVDYSAVEGSRNGILSCFSFGQKARWTDPNNFEQVCNRLLLQCSVSKVCIGIRAKKLASIPYDVQSGSLDSKLLLKSPNPNETWRAFVEAAETDLAIGGDLWLFLDKRIRGRPVLDTFRQDFIYSDEPDVLTYDPSRRLTGKKAPQYRFYMDGGVCTAAQASDGKSWTTIPAAIGHIMEHNPLSSSQGIGAGDAVLREVDSWVAINEHVHEQMRRKGMRDGVVIAPYLDSDEDRAKFENQMRSITPGETVILPEGAQFSPNQLSFSDLDLVATMDEYTRIIANAFNVPAVMMNLQGESSFANQRGADRIFYTGWVKPRAIWFKEHIEQFLRANLDPSLVIDIKETDIPYLQDDQLEKMQAMVASGCFTINEVREVMGYPASPKGDEIARSTAPSQPATANQDGGDPKNPREVSPSADTSRRPSEKTFSH